MVKNQPAKSGDLREASSVPGSGRSPERQHGNPLQYSCLENPMDGGAWRATVQRAAKSRTRLSDLARPIQTGIKTSPGEGVLRGPAAPGQRPALSPGAPPLLAGSRTAAGCRDSAALLRLGACQSSTQDNAARSMNSKQPNQVMRTRNLSGFSFRSCEMKITSNQIVMRVKEDTCNVFTTSGITESIQQSEFLI